MIIVPVKAHEHRSVGDAATARALVNLGGEGPGERFQLTHGDVVALAGDFFLPDAEEDTRWVAARGAETVGEANLFSLARLPGNRGGALGSRDEITAALRVMTYDEDFEDPRLAPGGELHELAGAPSAQRDEVERRVRERFLGLAAANGDHFVSPWADANPHLADAARGGRFGSAPQAYRQLHRLALRRAFGLGASGGDLASAMAHEAAAQHYLTDAFASGHLRTPVTAIRRFWHRRYPGFWDSLKTHMAEGSAAAMREIVPLSQALPRSLLDRRAVAVVRESTRRYPPVSLGDLLARVFHDWDNWEGLLVDGGDRLYGDGRLDRGPGRDLAVAAVREGNDDVELAFRLGTTRRAMPDEELFDEVARATGARPRCFRAEARIPVPSGANPPQNWMAADLETLWNRPIVGETGVTVGEAISEVVSLGGEVSRRLDCLGNGLVRVTGASSIPILRGWLSSRGCEAFHRGVIERLGREPKESLMEIVRRAPLDIDPTPEGELLW